MPLIFEQPNLDVPDETHLYFDAGDGRLITFFVRPTRQNDPAPNPEGIGNLHHLALMASRATYTQVAQRLNKRGIWNTGPIDRGFMDSIYFRDPNGQLLEIAVFKFEPPAGYTPRRCPCCGARDTNRRWRLQHRGKASGGRHRTAGVTPGHVP